MSASPHVRTWAASSPTAPWQADPFAGSTAIEVRHGGGHWRIDEPQVVARLLGALRVTGIENGVGRGSIPPTHLAFHKPDGTVLRASLEDDGVIGHGGLIYIEDGFAAALSREVSARAKRPVNLLKWDRSAPPATTTAPAPTYVEPSERSLTAGFRALDVSYLGGPRELRRARIRDPKVLDALHGALLIVKREPPPPRGTPSSSKEFTVESKDDSRFYADFIDAERFYADAGTFTVAPTFVRALNRHLSEVEGRPIDVLGENPPTPEQRRRAEAFTSLASGVKTIRMSREGRDVLVVDEPEAVAKIMARLKAPEAPLREQAGVPAEPVVELQKQDGSLLRLTFIDTNSEANVGTRAGPGGDLVRVEGFGQVWVDDQWKYEFQLHEERSRFARAQTLHDETTRTVAGDLGAFLPQVISVTVTYRYGDEVLTTTVLRPHGQALVKALEVERVERLDWSPQRWEAEVAELDGRSGGRLILTPGLGFGLHLYFTSDRELLVPPYGRVLLRRSPRDVVARFVADDAKEARELELAPRGRGKG